MNDAMVCKRILCLAVSFYTSSLVCAWWLRCWRVWSCVYGSLAVRTRSSHLRLYAAASFLNRCSSPICDDSSVGPPWKSTWFAMQTPLARSPLRQYSCSLVDFIFAAMTVRRCGLSTWLPHRHVSLPEKILHYLDFISRCFGIVIVAVLRYWCFYSHPPYICGNIYGNHLLLVVPSKSNPSARQSIHICIYIFMSSEQRIFWYIYRYGV